MCLIYRYFPPIHAYINTLLLLYSKLKCSAYLYIVNIKFDINILELHEETNSGDI